MIAKTEEYLNEVTAVNVITDLKRLQKLTDTLIRVYSNKDQPIDNDSKDNLLTMCETSMFTMSSEMSKLLDIQKKNGKEFMSDDDIDNLIYTIFEEENIDESNRDDRSDSEKVISYFISILGDEFTLVDVYTYEDLDEYCECTDVTKEFVLNTIENHLNVRYK
jgi:hypothetical protein